MPHQSHRGGGTFRLPRPRSCALVFGVSATPVNFNKGGRGVNANGSFTSHQAPCGRIVGGKNYEDHDDEVVVTNETIFECGCTTINHQYHDGSVSRTIVRHDGRVLIDELLSAE